MIFYVLALFLIICSIYGSYQFLNQADEEEIKPAAKNNTIVDQEPETESKDGGEPVNASIHNQWNLILINQANTISDNFQVDLVEVQSGRYVDKRAYAGLKQMLEDGEAEGLDMVVCSAYRTKEKQESLFQKEVQAYLNQGYGMEAAEEKAMFWVARPGTSEHHTGLAVDIVARSYQMLDKHQEETSEQKWLMENCYKYGFILRYPTDKSEITGIGYEPWHYRYVGVEAATEIMENNLCLEEYLEEN